MGKGNHYVPWFHGDFLRSTAGWTLMEQAVYWRLLCTQWEAGPLPNDTARLAAITGIAEAEFTPVWQSIVAKKFKSTKRGLVNRRMEEHRTNQEAHRRRQSEGGKKGMAKRWGKVVQLQPDHNQDGRSRDRLDNSLTK